MYRRPLTLIKEFTAAVEEMKTSHGNGTYHWKLGEDDRFTWAIVLGWQGGYESDVDDAYKNGTYRLCAKLAFQPKNSIMQCDYDVDWYMPYWKSTIHIYDTNWSLYAEDDLEDVIFWMLEVYKQDVLTGKVEGREW